MTFIAQTSDDSRASDDQPRWSALEIFIAVAPHRVSRLSDPVSAFEAQTRRAHDIAVGQGYGPRADGRYPLDIWMQVFRPE